MDEPDGQFEAIARQAGHIVGEAEISMRQMMGDEAFDAYKSNVIRCNAANATIQENVAKYHGNKAAFWGALSGAVVILTLAAVALVIFYIA